MSRGGKRPGAGRKKQSQGEAAPAEQQPSLRLEWLSPAELAENPANWKFHPERQLSALTDVIAEVGWAGACLYNERTQRLIDGHARKKVALDQGSVKVPVLVGNWTEEQEKKILATMDPLSAMAEADTPQLDALLREVQTGSESLGRMLTELAEKHGVVPARPSGAGQGDLGRPLESGASLPHVAHNSGEEEWYTPPDYLEAARQVLGGFDLDPASSEVAQHHVQAAEYYTRGDDGLSKPWRGRVWMNPPYSAGQVDLFITKLIGHYREGSVSSAIVLVNNATETAWFRVVADACSAICFPTGRVRFLDKEGNPNGAPLQGQAVLYLGERGETFCRIFATFGFCVTVRRAEDSAAVA